MTYTDWLPLPRDRRFAVRYIRLVFEKGVNLGTPTIRLDFFSTIMREGIQVLDDADIVMSFVISNV
jgi:hypothetical protein